MTKVEKSNFVKYARSKPGPEAQRYLRLFREIAMRKEFDPISLDRRLRKIGFPKQVHRIRNYLYKSIMDFLATKPTDINTEIMMLLNKATILSERKLYEQSNRTLVNAEKMASQNGKHNLLYEVNRVRRKNVLSEVPDSSELIRIMNLQLISVRETLIYTRLQKLNYQLWNISVNEDEIVDEGQKWQYFEYCQDVFADINSIEIRPSTRLFAHQVKYLFALVTDNYEGAVNELESAFLTLKNEPDLSISKNQLGAIVFNLGSLYLEGFEWAEFNRLIQEIKTFSNKSFLEGTSSSEAGFTYLQQVLNTLEITKKTLEYNFGQSGHAPVFSQFYPSHYPASLDYEILFNQAVLALHQGEFRPAFKRLTEIEGISGYKNLGRKVSIRITLMKTICQFKRGEMEYTLSLLGNLRRRLADTRLKVDNGLTKLLLSAIAALVRESYRSKNHQYQSQLENQLQRISRHVAAHPRDQKMLRLDVARILKS